MLNPYFGFQVGSVEDDEDDELNKEHWTETGRLSLAWRELTEINQQFVKKYKQLKYLDLSYNKLKDVEMLGHLTQLEVLILDGNRLTNESKIPQFKRLHTLWVNKNQIKSLSTFMDQLVVCCPKLRFLSMLGNDACPNFFNGGTSQQYTDYRYYVITRLPKLKILDDKVITQEEKLNSIQSYGRIDNHKASVEYEKARAKAEEKKKKKEKQLKKKRIREAKLRKEQRKEELKKKKEDEYLAAILPPIDSFSAPIKPPPPKMESSDWTSSSSSDEQSEWSTDDDLTRWHL